MPTTTAESAVVTEDRPPAPLLTATTAVAVKRVLLCFTILLRQIGAHPTLAFYFIFWKENAIMENNSQTRKKYSIED